MIFQRRSRLRSIDWATFSIFLGLIAVGWLMVFTVGYEEGAYNSLSGFFGTPAGKQTVWIGISFIVFWFIILIDWKFWQTFAYPLYAISLGLLAAVLFFGVTIKGATSWFSFGGFSFQPSEVAKFGTALAMASFLSASTTSMKEFRSIAVAFGLFLAPMALILLQPDAGSALVFGSFLIVLFRAGLSAAFYGIGFFVVGVLLAGLVVPPLQIVLLLVWGALVFMAFNTTKEERRYWLLGTALAGMGAYLALRLGDYRWQVFYTSVAALLGTGFYHLAKNNKARMVSGLAALVIVGSGLAILANYGFNNVLKPHQQDRINVWLQPDNCDPRGSLYNVLQSKMAIGSGGFEGKGFLKGTMTKLNYVPEQSTDFIFCTVGEEQGFIGSFGVIVLFLLLLIRLTIIAERQRFPFSRYYAYGVAGILFIHFFINIGMTMGLMPIIGIPLPFISKGGSSLLGFSVMIAVLLKLDSSRYRI